MKYFFYLFQSRNSPQIAPKFAVGQNGSPKHQKAVKKANKEPKNSTKNAMIFRKK